MKRNEKLLLPENLKRLGRYKAAGMNTTEIARSFQNLGVECSPKMIKNLLHHQEGLSKELIDGEEEIKQRIRASVEKLCDGIDRMGKRLWVIADKEGVAPRDAIAAMRELREQLDSKVRTLQKLVTKDKTVKNVNILQYNDMSMKNTEALEKRGYLTVWKKAGQFGVNKKIVEMTPTQLKELNKNRTLEVWNIVLQVKPINQEQVIIDAKEGEKEQNDE